MDCKSFNEHLDNYEFLSKETKDEMNCHADVCENCRNELDFMLSVMSTVKSLPKIEPPVDFMDKLNLRLDEEEKIKYGVVSRVSRNLRKNWKQYTALAACFALVAVITSNGRYLVKNISDDDSGIIQREDTVIDSDDENRPIPAIVTDETDSNEVQVDDSVAAAVAEKKREKTIVSSDVKVNEFAPVREVASAIDDLSPAKSNEIEAASDRLVIAPAARDIESEDERLVGEVAAYSMEASDYQIAPANISGEEIAAYSIDDEIPEIRSRVRDEDITGGYTLASNAKLANIRSRNTSSMYEENKAIGTIKISADNVEEVINLVLEYAYDVDGDLYTTSSDNLSLLLSSLNSKGVDYEDYTPGYEGEITFKLVIS